MTELLYMQDFDVETCDAEVLVVDQADDGRMDVVLDQTCFYARGGGQDWDMGVIGSDGTSFQVEEVRLDEVGVVHHIGKNVSGQLGVGDSVKCEVDHDRRAINTRLHSAAHVIDMAIDSLGLGWIATKGQHYPHLSAVEYSGVLDSEKATSLQAEIESLANQFIERGSNNTLKFMPVSEMHNFCRHVPENIPTDKPGRVVIYGENFGIPCGGTHVRDIAQVGTLKIAGLKTKRGVIRLSYSVGGINDENTNA